MASQSFHHRLASHAEPKAQPFARRKQSTGLFASGLGPQGAPPAGPGNPSPGWSVMSAFNAAGVVAVDGMRVQA